MQQLYTFFLLWACTFSFGYAQKLGVDNGEFVRGTIFTGVSPCLLFSINGNPETGTRSDFSSIGAHATFDYFLADNFAVGASLGGGRNVTHSTGVFSDSRFTSSQVELGVGADFYPPNTFCSGQVNGKWFKPFVGINTRFQIGRLRNASDNVEIITGFQDLNISLSAGMLINLKNNIFMGVEGNLIGISSRADINLDTNVTFNRNNSFTSMLNKSLMSLNFIRRF